jgi:hypothetical protein
VTSRTLRPTRDCDPQGRTARTYQLPEGASAPPAGGPALLSAAWAHACRPAASGGNPVLLAAAGEPVRGGGVAAAGQGEGRVDTPGGPSAQPRSGKPPPQSTATACLCSITVKVVARDPADPGRPPLAVQDVLLQVAAGADVGTLVDPATASAAGGSKAAATASSARAMALRARAASRQLQVGARA